MKKIKLGILLTTLLFVTVSSASEVKINFLDGCILKITHPDGERYIDLSNINYIKNEKGKITIPDRKYYMRQLDNDKKEIVLKEWLRCKASINK